MPNADQAAVPPRPTVPIRPNLHDRPERPEQHVSATRISSVAWATSPVLNASNAPVATIVFVNESRPRHPIQSTFHNPVPRPSSVRLDALAPKGACQDDTPSISGDYRAPAPTPPACHSGTGRNTAMSRQSGVHRPAPTQVLPRTDCVDQWSGGMRRRMG